MAWFFGDGWDLYASPADPVLNGSYWDTGTTTRYVFQPGRFTGSRAIQSNTSGSWLTKASNNNDTIHHFCLGWQQTAAISGTTLGFYIQLTDSATAQCSIVFRSDGAILLTSGGPTGTALATYTGAFPVASVWYAFEIEVVVNSTTGSFTVRKNGNTTADFTLGSLNTRVSTNNYANSITIGAQVNVASQYCDDFLWRSDPTSVPWVGDIRCYTRMPASDVQAQWTPAISGGAAIPFPNFPNAANSTTALSTNARYMPFTPDCDGNVTSITLVQATTGTAQNIKGCIYAATGPLAFSLPSPSTLLGTATNNPINTPAVGPFSFTFSPAVAVQRGVLYYFGIICDSAVNTVNQNNGTINGGYGGVLGGTTTYAAFPVANPPITVNSNYPICFTYNLVPTSAVNQPMIAESMQDGTITYLSGNALGQSDLYSIASIPVTPATVLGVVTRAMMEKTDAGTRNVSLNLQSGSTASSGTSTALNANWAWMYRLDLTDPATGATWTASRIKALQIGASVTA